MNNDLKNTLIKLIDQVIRSKKSTLSNDDLERLIVIRESLKHSKRKISFKNIIRVGNILGLKELIDAFRDSS